MRLGKQRASGNVEDRRGMRVVGGGLGVGGIVIALIAYFLGFDPSAVTWPSRSPPPKAKRRNSSSTGVWFQS